MAVWWQLGDSWVSTAIGVALLRHTLSCGSHAITPYHVGLTICVSPYHVGLALHHACITHNHMCHTCGMPASTLGTLGPLLPPLVTLVTLGPPLVTLVTLGPPLVNIVLIMLPFPEPACVPANRPVRRPSTACLLLPASYCQCFSSATLCHSPLRPCAPTCAAAVVFGRVLSGMEVVDAVQNSRVDRGARPLEPVLITDCGTLA